MTDELTADQREALTILQEEAAEVIHGISKMLRHGPDSRHPDGGLTNEKQVARETAQLIVMLSVCHATGLFDFFDSSSLARQWMVDKVENLRRYSTLSPAVLDQIEL